MAKSTNSAANEKYRQGIVEAVKEFFLARGEEVLQTASNKLAFPFVNELVSDEFIEITISVPKGSTKDKTPYDGYEQAQEYAMKKVETELRLKEAAEAKAKKIAFDEKKRAIAKKKADAAE